ncbi:MAG TPA: glycosyltransferase family 2 protein [Accumulibacter sp.]|uniref:glycosyltransferase family 2 protein n=1 Tax=Accumulibacter sp. TaxID=2053492 RepID=UPI002CD92961|nr:glycosyltransferase family 2 protein [Accumulibacter sp.]HRD90278.1 glycosyltransferase family 2 protein [Accumulibacter sp.]
MSTASPAAGSNTPMPAAPPPSVSVVVPVFGSGENLRELVSRVQAALSPLVSGLELILVNDGSGRGSWQLIEALTRREPQVRGLDLMRNYGQHNALLAGITRARNSIIVTMDDDLQHPPEELPKLLAAIAEGNDVAYGKPQRREHSPWRNLASRLTKRAVRAALGAEMAERSSAFRMFRAELKEGFAGFRDAQVSIDVLLSWSAERVACVAVDHHPRRQGRSGYNLCKLLTVTLGMVTGYSTLPLRLASGLGVLSATFGLGLLFWLLLQLLSAESQPSGLALIAAMIALFAGLQLFAIGVVGEYLARMHFRTLGKPAFVIRTETGTTAQQEKQDS